MEKKIVVAVIELFDSVMKDDGSCEYEELFQDRFVEIAKLIEKKLIATGIKEDFKYEDGKIRILFDDAEETEVKKILEQICNDIYIKDNESYFCGIGKTVYSEMDISKSYTIAHRIAELLRVDCLENEIKSYSQMGVEKIFLNLNQLDSLDEYYNDTIRPLDEYDEANDGNLVKTLEYYMYHNGSVFDTAVDMYVHRNIVNYKLKKIEAILGVNLLDFEVRNRLMTGLLVKKMRQIN